jgi:hypothetical protein
MIVTPAQASNKNEKKGDSIARVARVEERQPNDGLVAANE